MNYEHGDSQYFLSRIKRLRERGRGRRAARKNYTPRTHSDGTGECADPVYIVREQALGEIWYYEDVDSLQGTRRCLRTLGHGIESKMSTLTGAGNGLFVTRDVKKGELITEYAGEYLTQSQRRGLSVEETSHVRTLQFLRLFIKGIESSDVDIEGYGGGSLINDPITLNTGTHSFTRDERAHNTKYAVLRLRDDDTLLFRTLERHETLMIAVATKDIAKGSEVFVSYGDAYWESRI